MIKIICIITIIYLLLGSAALYIARRHYSKLYGMRQVVMNRIVLDYEVKDSGEKDSEEKDSEEKDSKEKDSDYRFNLDEYRSEFSGNAVPDEVEFIELSRAADSGEATDNNIDKKLGRNTQKSGGSEYVRPIYDTEQNLKGFLRFGYNSRDIKFTVGMAGVILLISYFGLILFIIIGYRNVIKPFNTLSEYPERLAKGYLGEGIPENKSRYFGRYIWGMNMLKDEMNYKDKTLNAMEKDKQTMIISIAHGIKTPLSNIKLYAEAIERGIYHEDKKPNEKDAETALKISENAEKVEMLVKEIMDSSAKPEVDIKSVITTFYLEEIESIIRREYTGRMEMLHIPFEIKCENNPMITSDRDGIVRILFQLLENAIKYGSGQGISVYMGRQDEDLLFSVKNKGQVLSEEETAYVFKSFWRGSNAKNIEGQGIGLYVSRRIAESLGGDIFMKSWEKKCEKEGDKEVEKEDVKESIKEGIMEVTLILPMI